MPRITNSVPKYRCHKASNQAFVEFHGRRIYLGKHGTAASKVRYDQLIAQWLANGRRLHFSDSSSITVTELVAEYWSFANSYYVKDGQKTEELAGTKTALRFLRELYGDLTVDQFGPLIALVLTMVAASSAGKLVQTILRTR